MVRKPTRAAPLAVRKPIRATPLAGRQAEARDNDPRILEAARQVFWEDPEAPIAAVARRAGVGISALYRRYRSKKILLDRVCLEGLRRYVAAAEKALADSAGDPWTVYSRFMREIVDADTHSNVLRLAGIFKPSKTLYRAAARAQALNLRLFNRTKAARVLRADIEASDIALLFEQVAAIRLGDTSRTARLRQRYLTLILDSLTPRPGPPLPGPPPTWEEINGRWG
jgi:AcrR family transcriptional regulator